VTAPIEWVNGPRLERDALSPHDRRRYSLANAKIVVDVRVGKTSKLREIELDEADLLTIIRRAAEVLSALKIRRDSGDNAR
jgi:hypothetical protein